jgi:hypothetical protein
MSSISFYAADRAWAASMQTMNDASSAPSAPVGGPSNDVFWGTPQLDISV